MAQDPRLEAPDNAPTSAPTPTQSVTPPPQAFGSNIAAETLGDAGKVASTAGEQAGQYATTVQQLNNKQLADSRYVDTSSAMNQYVDEYQANNRGMAAYTNSADAFTKLAGLRDKGAEGLSPLALIDYEANSRRALQYAQSTVRQFANQQRYTSLVDTNKAAIQTAQGQAVASDDPDVVNNSIATIAQTTAQQAKIQGWSDIEAQQNLHNDVGAVFLGKLKIAVDGGDQLKAQGILSAHSADMTAPQLEQAMGLVDRGHVSFQANLDRQNWTQGLPLVSAPSPAHSISSAIIGEESKGNDAVGSSPKGAIGPGQIEPATFAKYARPGEDINNPADNRAVSARIVNDYTQRYNGDAARVAVAYFSGPGNVSPAGAPQPYLHDYSDGHENVSQYVQHVTGAVGHNTPQPNTAPQIANYTDPNAFMADTYKAAQAYVDQKYASNPDQATSSLNSILSGATQQANFLRNSQESAYTQAAGLVVNGNLNDTSTIPSSLINSMSPTQRLALERDTNANASRYTPERQTNYLTYYGMLKSDPNAFANQDLAAQDLTTSERLGLMKEQASIRAGKPFKINTITEQAVTSQPAQQALKALGVTTPTGAVDHNSKDYFQFYGAMADKIDQWEGLNPGKSPDQKTLNTFVAQTTAMVGAKTGGFLGLGNSTGTPAFQVPDTDRNAIIASFAKTGQRPSEQDIQRIYRVGRGH